MSRRATVLIADDHSIVAEGLSQSLSRWYRVTGIVTTLEQLRPALTAHAPSVAVLDISFGSKSSLRMLPGLARDYPGTKFIILTAHDEPELAEQSIRSGALGFVIKRSAPTELRVAIEEAIEDRAYITPMVREPGAGDGICSTGPARAPATAISTTQLEVLRLLDSGLSHRDVADQLQISTKTIEYQLNLLRNKSGLARIDELIEWAEHQGDRDPDGSTPDNPDPED